MPDSLPIIVMIAPTGARKQKCDHPALPISKKEIVEEAIMCHEAGATAIHLHIRDKNGRHSIDSTTYKEHIAAIRAVLQDKMLIQVTSESCNIYKPEHQFMMIRHTHPESVSLALREIIPDRDESYLLQASSELSWMYQEKILPQFIFYEPDEIHYFASLVKRGAIAADHYFMLFVLGRYSKTQHSSPSDLTPFIDALHTTHLDKVTQWAAAAFGLSESLCMAEAVKLGGHVRIGFENNTLLSHGKAAPNNAALVQQFYSQNTTSLRNIASTNDMKRILSR